MKLARKNQIGHAIKGLGKQSQAKLNSKKSTRVLQGEPTAILLVAHPLSRTTKCCMPIFSHLSIFILLKTRRSKSIVNEFCL